MLTYGTRYSANNTYVGFYRMVHDAKHPGDDIPPLPHASTWFSHLEAPAPKEADESSSRRPKQRNRSASPADSDDIAIAGERRSLKCPLTLLPFKDPVTSTKCPHSFERQAIEDMIQKSTDSVAVKGGGPPQRMRCARCPVCSVKLTMNDLRRDPNLLRRVRRAQAAQTQQEEDEELNNSRRQKQLKRGRMSGFTVADDDDDEDTAEDEVEIGDDDDQDETKAEEIEIDENGSPTVIPNTQYSVEEDHMEE
jgi:E3 SUMO-protein ligase NSE2